MPRIIRRGFRVTKGVIEDLDILGMELSHQQIINRVKEGSPICHPSGNIKAGKLIFSVRDKSILGMCLEPHTTYIRNQYFQCDKCLDTKKIQVGDPCDFCKEGCTRCNDGLQFRTVTCPNCSIQPVRVTYERQNRIYIERQQGNGNRGGIHGKARGSQGCKISTRNKQPLRH